MTDDEDTTGVSRLLAGIRETGPMPEDLVQRIRTSLDEEQVAREDASGDPEAESTFWQDADAYGEVDEGEGGSRRRYGRWVLAGAAALVGVAALGSLTTGLLGGGDEGSSSGQADQKPQPSISTTAESGAAQKDGSVPAFVITRTDTNYTQEDFGRQAQPLLEGPSGLNEAPDDQLVGTMSSAAGAADCLARLGSPELVPVAVDIATFDGEPGVAIVAELPPDGKAKAFAVTTGCEPIWSEPATVPEG